MKNVERGKIIELRSLLAEKFPAAVSIPPMRSRLSTGVKILDQQLDGGLPEAALTEIVCPAQSMGSETIIHALIEAAHDARKPLVLVDAGNSFDPDGLTNEQLASMLWVPCDGPERAVQAADLLLRDGNLPLVVLDLMMCAERRVRAIPQSTWYRLQRVTEDNGTTALVINPAPVLASAACRLRLTHHFDLPALDLLRDQLTASLGLETLRARVMPPAIHVLSA